MRSNRGLSEASAEILIVHDEEGRIRLHLRRAEPWVARGSCSHERKDDRLRPSEEEEERGETKATLAASGSREPDIRITTVSKTGTTFRSKYRGRRHGGGGRHFACDITERKEFKRRLKRERAAP